MIFSREQCDNKIEELLKLFGLPDRILVSGDESFRAINYDEVFGRLETARAESTRFLEMELAL